MVNTTPLGGLICCVYCPVLAVLLGCWGYWAATLPLLSELCAILYTTQTKRYAV